MIKHLTVISGKGGSGKTTLTASLASLLPNPVIADGDVDAADLHLLLDPRVENTEDFYGMDVARKIDDLCIDCGRCYETCRFNAIDREINFHRDRCEGCAVCTLVCPTNAIEMVKRKSGEAYISETRLGPMVHARLIPGEESSGKLVAHVRSRAREIGEERGKEIVLVDGPPGSGCNVIASITGVDLVLIVVEPTVSGIHDAKRVLEVCHHFKIPSVAVMNKYDINERKTDEIREFLEKEGVEVIGKLPYTEVAVKAMIAGKTLAEFPGSPVIGELKSIADRIRTLLSLDPQ